MSNFQNFFRFWWRESLCWENGLKGKKKNKKNKEETQLPSDTEEGDYFVCAETHSDILPGEEWVLIAKDYTLSTLLVSVQFRFVWTSLIFKL